MKARYRTEYRLPQLTKEEIRQSVVIKNLKGGKDIYLFPPSVLKKMDGMVFEAIENLQFEKN